MSISLAVNERAVKEALTSKPLFIKPRRLSASRPYHGSDPTSALFHSDPLASSSDWFCTRTGNKIRTLFQFLLSSSVGTVLWTGAAFRGGACYFAITVEPLYATFYKRVFSQQLIAKACRIRAMRRCLRVARERKTVGHAHVSRDQFCNCVC